MPSRSCLPLAWKPCRGHCTFLAAIASPGRPGSGSLPSHMGSLSSRAGGPSLRALVGLLPECNVRQCLEQGLEEACYQVRGAAGASRLCCGVTRIPVPI